MMNNTHVGELLGQPVADLPVRSLLPSFNHNDFKNWSKFGMFRYASSTTARIFASSLNAGRMTDSDFTTL